MQKTKKLSSKEKVNNSIFNMKQSVTLKILLITTSTLRITTMMMRKPAVTKSITNHHNLSRRNKLPLQDLKKKCKKKQLQFKCPRNKLREIKKKKEAVILNH